MALSHYASSNGLLTYKQTAQNDKTFVAIKSVTLSKLNKKLKDNLTSEIAILKGLKHPHIVALIDCKESTSHIHLVMEYVALGDLSYFIKKRDSVKDNPAIGDMMLKYPNPRIGGLNEVIVRHFLQQLASALRFLRERNLIHRDVKPQNLLLNPSYQYFRDQKPEMMPYAASDSTLVPKCGIPSLPMLKIADFGFARSLPATSLAETLCGSPLYMAPEILRYEKYDAKADLWSVGTVLFEMMTGKPPFRASNHVELLRRIEKGEDRIKFPEDIIVSDPMKQIIRSLLKRDPKQRSSFPDFFEHDVIIGEIPGLASEDRPTAIKPAALRDVDRRRSSLTDPTGVGRRTSRHDRSDLRSEGTSAPVDDGFEPAPMAVPAKAADAVPSIAVRPTAKRHSTDHPSLDRPGTRDGTKEDRPISPEPPSRPRMISHETAPGRQQLHGRETREAATIVEEQPSRSSAANKPSLIQQQARDRENARIRRKKEEQEREQVAQDIAFERDYVLVEKRSVEVNAFADELAASPRIRNAAQQYPASLPTSNAMVRRATTQGNPTSTTGAQASASRAVQIASGRSRPEMGHHRQSSYERKYSPSAGSATSAIAKALNSASGRLFGVAFSPPALGRGGRSPPPGYNPFPTYPAPQTTNLLIEDGKGQAPNEDSRFVQNIEDVATRSDVVYSFAEVKYKQLIPSAPDTAAGLGLRQARGASPATDMVDDSSLTIEATVIVSEEALVLYVKALALLAKSMDIAGSWWARKNRGEIVPESGSPHGLSSTNPNTGLRMNNVVQWVRARFNEVLEKAEVVRLKLIDSQRKLPEGHPNHPGGLSNYAVASTGIGMSVDNVVVSTGITAEKLMYDRALEMSKQAAINELAGEDLAGCEISYDTAIRMLEAIIDGDDIMTSQKTSRSSTDNAHHDEDSPINGMEAEDRKIVRSRKSRSTNSQVAANRHLVVTSIKARLAALRKKLQVIQKRASAPIMYTPAKAPSPIPHRTSNPALASPPSR